MKRADLVRYIERWGCLLYRQGSKHSIYWNPANRKTSAVPRHSEIVDPLAVKICKDLGVARPK
ncbi:MAG: type II toxin-antitoxin system HicA family toxin [Bryobacteraceae bacterium]